MSDFDVALASPSLLDDATAAGVGLRSAGTRTGPLRAVDLERLGLGPLAEGLSQRAGRPVNFTIYGSADDAIARSPSIVVP